MKRSEYRLENCKQWLRSVFPYIERELSGARLRRNVLAALAVWLLSAFAAFHIVHSDGSLARGWRHSLDLESTKHEAINWPQCGFCLTAVNPQEVERIEEEIQKSTRKQREECVNLGYRSEACQGLPHKLRNALQRMEKPAVGLDPEEPWRRSPVFVEPPADDAWQSAVARDFLPTVELYRSPLSSEDFPRTWGIVAAWGLLPLLVILLPLRIVMRTGASLYHQSWSLLVATQQPVERILAGLVLQAALPVLMVAVPLLVTVMVQMLVLQGALGAALGFGLATLTLAALWSAFAVTLSVLAGRQVAPALLVFISMFVGLGYFIGLMESSQTIVEHASTSVPFMILHSGADLWLLALANFSDPLTRVAQHGFFRVEWLVASALLFVASLRWIDAHARRLVAQLEPALSRRGWYTSWAMAGGLLALRCIDYRLPFEFSGIYGCSSNFRESQVLAVIFTFMVPLASYLRHAVHPLARRSELMLDRASWWRAFKESWGAIGIMWGLCLLRSFFCLDLLWEILLSGAVLPGCFFMSIWIAMASGLSLLLARGLASGREKIIFGLVAVGTFVSSLLMFVAWFSTNAGRDLWEWAQFPSWAISIWLLCAGSVFLLLGREFGRSRNKIDGAA